MKPKVILKRIFHRNDWRYAIVFACDNELTNAVKSIDGIQWSQTHACWHAPGDEMALKQILTTLREKADIDISAIANGEKATVPSDRKRIAVPVKIKDPESKPHVVKKSQPIDIRDKVIIQEGYDAVLISINEADGRLIIKFTGKYDKDWIKELRAFGRPYYDSRRNEWLLRWSQITVDSLSDYFSGRGVEVIVKKKEIPAVLKEVRDEQGNIVRERTLNNEALEGIQLVRDFLEEKRYSHRTIESYLAHLELLFKYFHDRDPGDINEDDIAQFIEDHIVRLGYSTSYQNLVISAIKMYFSLTGIKRLRLDSFERPRRSRALPKVFSKDEVKKILDASRNNKHKLLLWMIYSCGLRRGEVINIRLTDLDRERRLVHIREAKGNLDRVVPVSEKVWSKIDEYLAGYTPQKYLFEGQAKGRYSSESVYNVFKQALRIAGIKRDVGVHCLRHSYATHLHESGLDIRFIQELLGHKSSRTTEIYTHVSRRNLIAIRSPIEDLDLR